MKEQAMAFPRKDDGPQRVVGKVDPHEHGVKFSKIRVFVGPRKAARAIRLG